ncbi:hypothetical protein [Sphingobium aquiterrae]|uniref:hypothetical protein n=1 Tax=Sphingobium aquiterrae TaxID=2038656 RepID=UPI003015AA3F
MTPKFLIVPLGAVLLQGCIAKTAVDVVTLPVRAGAQAADWATTSQEESDRNYGRKMRKQEAREAREAKEAAKERRRQCHAQGHDEDC